MRSKTTPVIKTPRAARAARHFTALCIGALAFGFAFNSNRAGAAPVWQGYGGDSSHTAISSVASQPLETIHWQMSVDDAYPGAGIHYGSPTITAANTVVVPVRQAGSTFRIEGRDGGNGALKWTQTSDYALPPDGYSWIPPFAPTLTPASRLYYPAGGGSVMFRDALDAAGAVAPGRVAFYGAYNAAYNAGVYINTPITSDTSGNIYFGYRVTNAGAAPVGLQSGIARITPAGAGTWTPASSIATGGSAIAQNCAPALSPDGKNVYVVTSNGRLASLNSTTLAHQNDIALPGSVYGDSTSSPAVGPDGDVYYGVLGGPGSATFFRGTMTHYSADLSLAKPVGSFGWDDTASIVPRSMVPSYAGTSSYLLMTKYNNYAGLGSGDGVNKLAILDPNVTDPATGAMKEVLTIAGITPDPDHPDFPNAVREWCINTAVVDPATHSILANNEDGSVYRWDLFTNTLSQAVNLTSGVGEAYTPTVIGADGAVYAINEGKLFNVGAVPEPGMAGMLLVLTACRLRRGRSERSRRAGMAVSRKREFQKFIDISDTNPYVGVGFNASGSLEWESRHG